MSLFTDYLVPITSIPFKENLSVHTLPFTAFDVYDLCLSCLRIKANQVGLLINELRGFLLEKLPVPTPIFLIKPKILGYLSHNSRT